MSAPELRVQQAMATVLRLVHEVAVLRARVLLPESDDGPTTVVSLEPHGPLLVERPQGTVEIPHEELPHGAEPDVAMPATPELGPYPAFEIDPATGTVTGMIGALGGLGVALTRLSAAMGEDVVVGCELRTTDPTSPLGVVARAGEPVVALLGDDAYEIPT
ncbi:MAG: hypothetical protein JHD16_12215 [Solirubrobacteraceae bacterium]|nr:hypothetical protein [Solirubrobacteraceae bacterium]